MKKAVSALIYMLLFDPAGRNLAVAAPSNVQVSDATFEQGWGAYQVQNYKEAMRLFRRSADTGDAKAEYQIGEMYELGRGVTEDMAQAMEWFRRAADRGLPQAQVSVGLLYANGWGVTQDYVEAQRWYRKAADQGYPLAQSFVGIAYVNGLGVIPNFEEARVWLGKAIEGGVMDAQYYLCTPYLEAWLEALANKNTNRMDEVISKVDPHCTELLAQAKTARAKLGS